MSNKLMTAWWIFSGPVTRANMRNEWENFSKTLSAIFIKHFFLSQPNIHSHFHTSTYVLSMLTVVDTIKTIYTAKPRHLTAALQTVAEDFFV